MSKRSEWLWLGFFVLLIVAIYLGLWVSSPAPEPETNITGGQFVRIKVGMTLAEVEAILGRPADYERLPGTGWVTHLSRTWENQFSDGITKGAGRVKVYFLEDGTVFDKEKFEKINWRPRTLWDHIRPRLGFSH